MSRAEIPSGLNWLTKRQRTVIGRLGEEWAVLDEAERVLSKVMLKHYFPLKFGVEGERTPEIVEMERQQRELFRRKRKIIAQFGALEKEGTPPKQPTTGKKRNPMVEVRNLFIRSVKHRSDRDICQQLDLELMQRDMPPLGFPEKWLEKYGVESYLTAYKHPKCKALVQKLISVAKRAY